jgi:aminoglycoside phosphotransferase (APT) family kinase protein
MHDNALVALAGIQGADITRLAPDTIGHPDRGGSALAQQIAHYEHLYAWTAAGRAHPTIEAALEWIHSNAPAGEPPPGLSWGDARVGNLMFGADLSVTGVLDWEMATIGAAELDLAWFLFLDRTYTEGMGVAPLPGVPSREVSIARYEELIGRPLVDFDFHEVLAATRATILMMRVGTMMIEAGFLPADAPMPFSNPASQLLAAIIGQPQPTGGSSWISESREAI